MPSYCTGISQPANGTSRAPAARGGRTGACGAGCRRRAASAREATACPAPGASTSAATTASATSARLRSDVGAHPLLRRVGAAAARAQAVDGQRDRLRHVRLASLAPPRSPATSGRPSSAAGPVQQLRRRAARVSMPGQARTSVVLERARRRAPRGPPRAPGRRPPRRSARRSQTSSPGGGDHVEGVAGAQDRRHGGEAVGAVRSRLPPPPAGPPSASASRALRPRCGAEPECAGRPCACTRSVPAALRLTITASSPARRALAGLEAEAGVEAGEALGVAEGDRAPLLVVHQQHGGLGVQLGPPGQLAHHAQRQRHAALHVDGARAGQAVAVALERPVRAVRHDGVEVAEQQQPRLARRRAAARPGPRRAPRWSRASARSRPPAAGRRHRARPPPRPRRTSPDGVGDADQRLAARARP